MIDLQTILLADFYKTVHADQYDPKITKLVSYYVPRMSRFKNINSVPVIGIQSFIKEYLIEHFNTYFFKRPLSEIISEYTDVITQTMGVNRLHIDRIIALHNLGYIPLEISAIEEGYLIPIGCPAIQITNTHPAFAWVVNAIESLMSNELWYQTCTAMAGREYRNIVNEAYRKTSDHPENARHAISEFGFRGLPGLAAATKASMGFLLSFDKTATIPSIYYIHKYYGDNMKDIGGGMASTEHSVMTSSYAIDGNEETLIHRLLTEVYPDGNFAMVCDSYDYWNVVKNILPKFKEEILSRNGTLYVRGDSGDPVQIITHTVYELWDIFGGTTNSKGYKVLDSHVRAIYGDSITQRRAKQIYDTLAEHGFAADNVALGAGSFSMLCHEDETEEGNIILNPYTRDVYGVAIKSCAGSYIKFVDQLDDSKRRVLTQEIQIFKDPKTDTGHFKKSHKGWIGVYYGKEGNIHYKDGMSAFEKEKYLLSDLLYPVFENGKLLRETSFKDIRTRFWCGQF